MTNDTVRYCSECGHVGEVPEGAVNCCPDGSRARHVPLATAEQAHLGFQAGLRMRADTVDRAIVDRIVPELCRVLNDVLKGDPSKATVMDARKLLPPRYSQSIANQKGKA